MGTLSCPYCEKDCEADCESNDPMRTYEHECEHCEKNFVYTLDYEVHYSEHQAPCLNGEEHDWADDKGWPKEHFAGKQHCRVCDKRREMEREAPPPTPWPGSASGQGLSESAYESGAPNLLPEKI